MINLTIEDKNYILAESWAEITFDQYINIINIAKEDKMSEFERAIKIVAQLSNQPIECEEYILKLEKSDFEEMASYFEWASKPIEEVAAAKDILEIDGRTYKIKNEYNKLSIGEMISVETLIANEKSLDPFEIVFGVLLREIVDGKEKEFNEDDFIYIVSKLKTKVMLLDVYNHISFFLSGVQKSITPTTKTFSIRKMVKN